MKSKLILALAIGLLSTASATAQERNDSIPARAIILTGDINNPENYATLLEMYSRANMAFQDPAAPRFLFMDKEGKAALGIGGYVKAVGMYDFSGAIASNGFSTNLIPVPSDPSQRSRLGATANHSSLFLKMVTRPTGLGRVIVYMQANFSGDGDKYGFQLKQAYVKVGNVTLGKARTTFADAEAMAPTVEDQGPSGQVSAKNMMVQYSSPHYKGFSWAISGEIPTASYTLAPQTETISQRFPDIPAYVQYSWGKSHDSHIRLSGILRELSYRDLTNSQNKFVTGWGVQASAIANLVGGLNFFGHYTYGCGIAQYVNDSSGESLDLIPDGTGRLKAARSAGWTAGLQYTFSKRFFVSSAYSQARMYGLSELGGDTYKYGQYIVANAFFTPWDEVQIGVEYLHGTRKNYDNQGGHANRIDVMLQYNF